MKPDIYIAQKIINLLDKYKKIREKPQDEQSEEDKWNDLFKNQSRFIFPLDNNLKIFLYKDSILSKLIYDGFEKTEEVFIQKFLQKGDIFFDIGANIGLHTLIAGEILKTSGHVYSFEPTPVTYSRLLENITENNLEKNITTVPLGLSDEISTLDFNTFTDGYDAWNSFANLIHVPLNTQIKLEVTTAYDFINKNNIGYDKISLIKIDVEGWEINVLKGMEKLFSDDKFEPCFLIEFTEENMFRAGYSCKELYNFMLNKGYKWYQYNPDINQVGPAELKAYYPYENLIATKNIEQLNARLSTTN